MKGSSEPRQRANLSDSVDQRLNKYALAASAAGVGILALVQPAEARIVYTPAHHKIAPNTSHLLDLNHDGLVDFGFLNSVSGRYDALIMEPGDKRNEVWASANGDASALRAGVLIKAGPKFLSHSWNMLKAFVTSHGHTQFSGQWKNVSNRYLGLKFILHGKFHYGWARLNVKVQGFSITATLTGYAYETIPNKAIITGKTKGPEQVEAPDAALMLPTPQPATLGMLALGAPALAIWRREESVGATR